MRRTRLELAAASLAIVVTAGCASTAGKSTGLPPETAGTSTTAAATGAASASASSAPTAAPTSAPAPAGGYDSSRDANADIRAALAAAGQDHREVLLDFGATWCPDCRVLGTLFDSSAVTPVLRQNYHVVSVDIGRFNHNLDLAAKYVDLQSSGIPALVVLKADGTVRTATNDGSFSNARTMDAGQVNDFLARWAPGGGQ
jgi:thiol:disulfide interchange protein